MLTFLWNKGKERTLSDDIAHRLNVVTKWLQ